MQAAIDHLLQQASELRKHAASWRSQADELQWKADRFRKDAARLDDEIDQLEVAAIELEGKGASTANAGPSDGAGKVPPPRD